MSARKLAYRKKIKARPLANVVIKEQEDTQCVNENFKKKIITRFKSPCFIANSEETIPLDCIDELGEEEYECNELAEENTFFVGIDGVQEEEEQEEIQEVFINKYSKETKMKKHADNSKTENTQAEMAGRSDVLNTILQKTVKQPKFLRKSKKPLTKTQSEKELAVEDELVKTEEEFLPILKEKSIFEMKNTALDNQQHFESKVVVKPNIYPMLRLAFEQNLTPSVRIQINNVFIDCHMMVLKCYSDFFSKCGNAQLVVLPPKAISVSAFRMFYAWCLSGNPMLSVATIVDLMKTAMYLRVSVLVDICFQHLYDDLFSEDVAFYVYIKAHKACLPFVAHLMLTRIGRFFLPMVACREFLDLNPREMMELLDADLLGVHTEAEVLFSLVRWSSHDWETRKSFMLKLARKVRFGLMPVWYLYLLLRGTGVKALDRVLCSKGVKNFIADSLVFALGREEANSVRDELFKNMRLRKIPSFRERLWIIQDPTKRDEFYASLSYGAFLKYLHQLRSKDLKEFRTFAIGSNPKPRNNDADLQKNKPLVMFKKVNENEEYEIEQKSIPETLNESKQKFKKSLAQEKIEKADSQLVQETKHEETSLPSASSQQRTSRLKVKKKNSKI